MWNEADFSGLGSTVATIGQDIYQQRGISVDLRDFNSPRYEELSRDWPPDGSNIKCRIFVLVSGDAAIQAAPPDNAAILGEVNDRTYCEQAACCRYFIKYRDPTTAQHELDDDARELVTEIDSYAWSPINQLDGRIRH
ncbi:hypothetical protein GCM10010862_09140 [Devosia nitrariae]|uniref:Uncharacterized protein n=1 Tax=Devosia nitrariae TaxID=2071872 RepID=A0ABQ5W162_9HYPH|nr:hypothetical protein GCM10010862_09140 [Devosia nitrariae]